MTATHADRCARLRTDTTALEVDALLVTRLVNVRYLTGFTGSHAALLLLADTAVLATDGRYDTQAREQAPDVDLVIERDLARVLADRAVAAGAKRIAFEEHDTTVAAYDGLSSVADGAELVRMGQPVEALRAVKDETEIATLARACHIADAAFALLLDGDLRAGRTERQIAHALEQHMRELGASGPSFDTIVASGPNSAIPHHQPTDREVQVGDFVKCDFGALVDGYHSDITRTVVVGTAAGWQREVYAVVAAAQQAGRDAARPGATCRDVDARAREIIEASEYAGRFVHPLGHGVGLEIHERPTLAPTATDSIAERMPVTVEPGVYLPGQGGVRIEDTLVVRPDGPELLTATTRELLEV
ncbi:MAG: M24 family metallopeptidase [Actinomycetes bacterium]